MTKNSFIRKMAATMAGQYICKDHRDVPREQAVKDAMDCALEDARLMADHIQAFIPFDGNERQDTALQAERATSVIEDREDAPHPVIAVPVAMMACPTCNGGKQVQTSNGVVNCSQCVGSGVVPETSS